MRPCTVGITSLSTSHYLSVLSISHVRCCGSELKLCRWMGVSKWMNKNGRGYGEVVSQNVYRLTLPKITDRFAVMAAVALIYCI